MIGYKPVVSLILALLFIFFVVRPLLKRRAFSPGEIGTSLLQSVPQPGIPSEIAEKKPASINYRDQMVQLTQEDPSKAARIVKSWLHEKE